MFVVLTWTDDVNQHTEIVKLVSEEDRLYFAGNPAPITISDMIKESGRVFFEDKTGVFGLMPDQVISIEPVDSDA